MQDPNLMLLLINSDGRYSPLIGGLVSQMVGYQECLVRQGTQPQIKGILPEKNHYLLPEYSDRTIANLPANHLKKTPVQLTLAKVIARISRQLVTQETVDIKQILAHIGAAMDVNRICLWQLHHQGTQVSLTHGWSQSWEPDNPESWQDLDTTLFPWIIHKLRSDENIIICDPAHLPQLGQKVQEYLKFARIRSALCIPIQASSGQLWGAICCANHHSQRKLWSAQEIQWLRVAGEMISSYLDKRQLQSQLHTSQVLYESIFNATTDSMFVMAVQSGNKFVYEALNPAYEQVLGKNRAQLLGKTPQQALSPSSANHLNANLLTCLTTAQPISYEETTDLAGETEIWQTTLVPIKDGSGTVVKLQGNSRLISRPKQPLEAQIQDCQKLARSNAQLEQFAHVISHDLREPLQTIVGFAQLLKQRYHQQLDAKADKFIDHVVNSSLHLQNMIKGLLAYSRTDSSQDDFQYANCELIVQQAIANLEHTIRQEQAIVTYDPLPWLWADPVQLVQLFQNLLSNALKYRRDEPPVIHISAQYRQQAYCFSVQDNGIGINPNYTKRIFEIFQRLHTQEEYPGTGIGLAICQRIVQLHGGQIWVESKSGLGTTFYFTIPQTDK